ncbi:hypothetical protein HHK36_007473 [Tetracentron sinense]|uniref:Drought induced 19 protein type zinc-binding domain-containing protein n=1 Tax=Tetracentron sinense TaxID=13715 RepID=A0A834ZJC0_TETSI|nr:hypothetical protein HHK36_007473 [Tetracentron sinense]
MVVLSMLSSSQRGMNFKPWIIPLTVESAPRRFEHSAEPSALLIEFVSDPEELLVARKLTLAAGKSTHIAVLADTMDVDFWATRVRSVKHLTAVQAARLNSVVFQFEVPGNHLSLDNSEADDDARVCFPCPFCYVDIEVPVLCAHLQEEHCFDVKNAVCPVCAANLGKDMIGHFTVQHAHLLKRRRKSQRSGMRTNSSAMLGKEHRELSSFLGVTSTNSRRDTPDSAPDPLLSPFLCSAALPDTESNQDTCSSDDTSTSSDLKSTEPSTPNEAREHDNEERKQRAEFFQQLILSTIF